MFYYYLDDWMLLVTSIRFYYSFVIFIVMVNNYDVDAMTAIIVNLHPKTLSLRLLSCKSLFIFIFVFIFPFITPSHQYPYSYCLH